MSRSVMTLRLGASLPESLSLLHRRLLVAERQGADLATKLGVSGGELDTELMDSSKPEALETRVCRLESLLHTLRLSVFRVETERDLNSSHAERLQEQLAALQEQSEEEQRCSRRAVMRLRNQMQQEREEAQREAYTLREQLHVSHSSRTDVFAAVDELKKIKVQLNQKLHQLKEEAARETAARLEAERSHDALLRRVKELEVEVESEKEQVKRLQDNVHALKVDGQEVRAELELKAELVQSLQEERQQLMERLEEKAILASDLGAELKSMRITLQEQKQENTTLLRAREKMRAAKDKVQALNDQLEAQCSDLSSALHSLTEEKTQLQAVLKKEQERTAERLKDMDLQLDAAKRNLQCEVQEALAARRLLNKELETLRLDHTKLQQSSAAALDAAVHHQELLERTIKRLRGELSNVFEERETMQKQREEVCAELEIVRTNYKSLQKQLKQVQEELQLKKALRDVSCRSCDLTQTNWELREKVCEQENLTSNQNARIQSQRVELKQRHRTELNISARSEPLEQLRNDVASLQAVLHDLSSSQQEELQAERFLTHTLQEKCQMLQDCVSKLKEERNEAEQKMNQVSLESQKISENLQEAHGWFRSKFASLKVGSGHSRASFPGRSGDFRNDGNETAYGPSKVGCVAEPELERWDYTLQRWEAKKELDRMANDYKASAHTHSVT